MATDYFLPLSSVEIAGPRPVSVGCELNSTGPSGGYTKRCLAHEHPGSSFPEPALGVRAAIPIFESKSLLNPCHSCKLGFSCAVGEEL